MILKHISKMGAIMLSTLLVLVAVQASVQLPPQERENRNRLIVHYARYQVYTAAEILQILAIIHGYVLRYVMYKQLQE